MSATLDLEQLDKIDLEKDPQKCVVLIDSVYEDSQPYLQRLARLWDENIHFFEGNQHIFYDEVTRRYEIIPTNEFNKWIPRPVTNLIQPTVLTMQSLLTRQRPEAITQPNSRDPADINASKLAERVCDAKWDMDEETTKHIQASMTAMLCGHVFRKDYWDAGAGPFSEILQAPVGDNAVEMVDPFRIIPDIQSGSYFLEASIQPLWWIRSQYDQPPIDQMGRPTGYTGLASKVREDKKLSPILSIQQRLKSISGRGTDSSLYAGDTERTMDSHAVVKEVYIRPTRKNERGLLIVVADNKVLYRGPSPYFDSRYKDSWHPYSEFKWIDCVFRYHGLSMVESLVPLQRRLNSIDALVIINRMTMVNPIWLIPTGVGIKNGFLSGAPGLEVFWNPAAGNGAKPERLPGIGLPADIYKEREALLEAFHQIAGDAEVLQGLQPSGVDSGVQMNMLIEQASSKFNPIIQSWERFISQGQTKKMRLIANRYIENRPDFTNRLQALNRDNTEVEIKDFTGAQLNNNVNIRIEAGSSLPKSKVYELQLYQDLAKGGLFGSLDPDQNPIGNQQFLEKFGIQPIETELNADVEKARWVVSVLTAINRGELTPDKYPPLQPFDNPMIHQKIVTDYMKDPNFQDPSGVFQNKMQEIGMAVQQAQMNQPQPPPGAPMGHPPGPPGPPPPGMHPPPHHGLSSHPNVSGLPVARSPQGESPPPIGPGVGQVLPH